MIFTDTVKLFLQIAELGSFSKASKELYIAKSSAKKQMDSLEQELGVPLFERSPSGLKLTPAGMVFEQESRSIVQSIENLKTKCKQAMDAASSRVLRVAHYSDFIFPFIQYCCDLYLKTYPNDQIHPVLTTFDNAYNGIREGLFDIAFCPKAGTFESAGILSQLTFRTPMCGLVSYSNDLAQKSALSRLDLATHQVATHRIWFQQDQVEIWSKQAQPSFDVTPLRGGTDDIQQVCSNGGIYLYPASDAFVLPYVQMPLEDPLVMNGGCAYRIDPSPATRDFAKIIEDYIASQRDTSTLLLKHDFSNRAR